MAVVLRANYELKCASADTCSIWTPATNEVKNFAYTGSSQGVVLAKAGYYKLETWGAQGGTYLRNSNNYGAYSVGIYSSAEGSDIYVYVGGAGTYHAGARVDYSWSATGTERFYAEGGFNGGGMIDFMMSNDIFVNSGGGATHIATVLGLLKDLESYKDTGGSNISNEILIVSGGGGASGGYKSGSYYSGSSAAGGIQSSNVGSYCSGQTASEKHFVMGGMATQTSGYSFGEGAPNGQASGGGGWYGRGVGGTMTQLSAGGSSYIGSSNLISGGSITKHMTCYSCTTSSTTSTYTISNTNVSATATADYSKTGNGYARITYLGTSI